AHLLSSSLEIPFRYPPSPNSLFQIPFPRPKRILEMLCRITKAIRFHFGCTKIRRNLPVPLQIPSRPKLRIRLLILSLPKEFDPSITKIVRTLRLFILGSRKFRLRPADGCRGECERQEPWKSESKLHP